MVVRVGRGSGDSPQTCGPIVTPSRWLTDHRDLLPASGSALDVACGRGRNALWLAQQGFSTHAIDRSPEAVQELRDEAARRGLRIAASVLNLEQQDVSLGEAAYDVVVVTHYLHRPLFPALLRALKPRGVLVYETFTTGQAARGKPTNPAFLLGEGELRQLVRPLRILDEREGDFEGRLVASVIAAAP